MQIVYLIIQNFFPPQSYAYNIFVCKSGRHFMEKGNKKII